MALEGKFCSEAFLCCPLSKSKLVTPDDEDDVVAPYRFSVTGLAPCHPAAVCLAKAATQVSLETKSGRFRI